MARLNLAPGWYIYISELQQMFKYDKEVHIVYDDENYNVKVYVDDSAKATALDDLLPPQKEFGNVILTIEVIPANGFSTYKQNVFEAAFKNNPVFSFVKTVSGIFPNDLTYVVVNNKVVQYYIDNLGDIYGNRSTLYQDIANNIFTPLEGVFYCTDIEEPVYTDKPLGEWP